VAARRLIFVMLALLVVSSIAAALAPVRDTGEEPSTTTSPSTAPPPQARTVTRTIDAGDDERVAIAIERGDQLELTVRAGRTDLVEIDGLGELEDVTPDAPAHFDLLPREPGIYVVRMLDAGRTLGSIEVAPRVADRGGEPRQERGAARPERPGGNGEGS
jgi:hypothetical protein